MITDWIKFEHEMRLGRLLCDAHHRTRAVGFRGLHKNRGFKGFCESQGVPLRRAYRLMRRYTLVLGTVLGEFLPEDVKASIQDSERVTNDAFPPSEVFEAFMDETLDEFSKSFSRIADCAPVTNVNEGGA
jgi:hypothetical protein